MGYKELLELLNKAESKAEYYKLLLANLDTVLIHSEYTSKGVVARDLGMHMSKLGYVLEVLIALQESCEEL